MHETWRATFPDTRKMPIDAPQLEALTSAALANTEDGIEDGDVSAEPPPEDNTVNPVESTTKNRWEELPHVWRFHKINGLAS